MKYIILALILPLHSYSASFSKKQIHLAKEELVKLSVMSSGANCVCPYHLTRNGTMCGKKSFYSSGARGPTCYVEDVSDAMAIEYLKNH